MDKYFNNFNYEVVHDSCPLFTADQFGLYDFKNNVIYIKESTFSEACDDSGRSRFVIAHEIAHWFLYNIYDYKPIQERTLKPKVYLDVEWQADCLAGMILAPSNEIIGLETNDIMKKYLVSEECATYRLIQLKK